MSLTVRGKATKSTTSNASISINQADYDVRPSEGDLIVLFAFAAYDPKGNSTPANPANWQIRDQYNDNNGTVINIYSRTATGTSADNVTFAPNASWFLSQMEAIAIKSDGTVYPAFGEVAHVNSNSETNTVTAPSVTTTEPNELLMTFHWKVGSAISFTPPTGMTEVLDPAVASIDNAEANTQIISSPGATGTKVATPSSVAANITIGFSITIKPSTIMPLTPVSSWVAGTTSPLTPTMPVDVVQNDFLILTIYAKANSGTTFNPGGTWTKRTTNVNTTPSPDTLIETWYKFAGVSEAAPSTTNSSPGGGWAMELMAYRNVNQTTPFDVADVTDTGTTAGPSSYTMTPSNLTTVTNAAMVVVALNKASFDSTIQVNTSNRFTSEMVGSAFTNPYSNGNVAGGYVDRMVGTAGAVTSPVFLDPSVAGSWASIVFALRPVAGATVIPLTSARMFLGVG